MTERDIQVGQAAVRKLVDEKAGWYARLITDEYCREIAIVVLAAVEQRGKPK